MKAIMAALLACSVSASWAALGGHPAQFGARAVRAQMQPAATAVTGYTVNRTTLDSGTTVREYVDASGTVFAVSWSGPVLPDLKQLLGPYFDTLAAPRSNPHQRRGQRMIKQSDVVIGFYIIFPELKKVVRPLKVEKKILFITVENSILRSELKFQESLIVSKVNKYFKEERIKGIRFQ